MCTFLIFHNIPTRSCWSLSHYASRTTLLSGHCCSSVSTQRAFGSSIPSISLFCLFPLTSPSHDVTTWSTDYQQTDSPATPPWSSMTGGVIPPSWPLLRGARSWGVRGFPRWVDLIWESLRIKPNTLVRDIGMLSFADSHILKLLESHLASPIVVYHLLWSGGGGQFPSRISRIPLSRRGMHMGSSQWGVIQISASQRT